MFLWSAQRILAEMHQSMPDLAGKLSEIARAWHTPEKAAVLQRIWPTIQSETIDFGVMEKAQQVAVIPAASLGWNDVGSWESLFDVLPADELGNVVVGAEHVGVDTHNTLVLSEVPGRLVATIGVQDLIVIDTGSAVLICSRDQAQKVRQVVDELKKNRQGRYL
jgi:mannose-1-phosphate guanylyltransferase